MTTYKDFDLQKAIDGHPLVTRDGRDILDCKWWKISKIFIALISPEQEGSPYDMISYDECGRVYRGQESSYDLFLKPQKKKLYIAVLKESYENNPHIHQTTNAFSSEEKLRLDTSSEYLKLCQVIEVEISI